MTKEYITKAHYPQGEQMKDSNWDLDYRAGLEGESKVADLLHIDTVEVKTDKRWVETGNLYIETECYYQNEDAWKPSGIRVSQATHWGFVLEDSILIVPLHRLKEIVWESGRPITCNIPPNPSRGYLITPGALMEHVRTARTREIQEFNDFEASRLNG
jgi:hypothetical protein